MNAWMRQVPWWAWVVLVVSALLFVTQRYTQHVVETYEEKALRSEKSGPEPILARVKLELTPAATATAIISFPAKGHEAAVELSSAVKYPEVEITATPVLDIDGNPIDLEYCRMLRESGVYPQTVEDVIARYEVPVESDMVPLSKTPITLIPYHECEEKGTDGKLNGKVHLYWAFLVGNQDSVLKTRVKVPEGGLATRVEGLPPNKEVDSGIVEGRYMQVRGVPPQKTNSK